MYNQCVWWWPHSVIPAVFTSIAAERNSNWLRNVGSVMYHRTRTCYAGCRVMHFRCFRLLSPTWRLLAGSLEGNVVKRGLQTASSLLCFLLAVGHPLNSLKALCFLVAYLPEWQSEGPTFLSNSQKCCSEERGWWNYHPFVTQFSSR